MMPNPFRTPMDTPLHPDEEPCRIEATAGSTQYNPTIETRSFDRSDPGAHMPCIGVRVRGPGWSRKTEHLDVMLRADEATQLALDILDRIEHVVGEGDSARSHWSPWHDRLDGIFQELSRSGFAQRSRA